MSIYENKLFAWGKILKPKNGQGPWVKLVGMRHQGSREYYYQVQSFIEEHATRSIVFPESVDFSDIPETEACTKLQILTLAPLPTLDEVWHFRFYAQNWLFHTNYLSQYFYKMVPADVSGFTLLELFLKTQLAKKHLESVVEAQGQPVCEQLVYALQSLNETAEDVDFCGLKQVNLLEISSETLQDLLANCVDVPYTRQELAFQTVAILDNTQTRLSSLNPAEVFIEALLDFRNDYLIEQMKPYLSPKYDDFYLVIPWGALHMQLRNGKGIEDRLINEFGYEVVSQKPFAVFEF